MSYEHIQLTVCYSVMNVRLAAQTLRATTVSVLRTYYGDDTSEAALFCKNMNNFSNALNVRNTPESVKIFLNLDKILMIQGLIGFKMYF